MKDDNPRELTHESIQWVPKKYYAALAKENEELKAQLVNKADLPRWIFLEKERDTWLDRFAAAQKEITSLRESLKLAVEAVSRCMFELDKCTNGHVIDPHRRDLAIEAYKYGRETLAKIKAKHGEL